MNELIVDGNTTEVSTKSTGTISIVMIQFHLQHSKALTFVHILTLILQH